MKALLKNALLLIVAFSISNAFAETDPKQMLEQVAENLISYLKENKEKLSTEPDLTKDLVRKELLPYIDEVGLGRRVLAKHWKNANPEQQKMFIDKFINLVIDTYAKGLAQYSGQTFTFKDTEYNKKGTTARVQSTMVQDGSEPLKISYLLKKPKGLDEWRVVDVSIEGVSMVQNYRNQFGQQIKNEGLDSVLDKLAKNEIKLSDDSNKKD